MTGGRAHPRAADWIRRGTVALAATGVFTWLIRLNAIVVCWSRDSRLSFPRVTKTTNLFCTRSNVRDGTDFNIYLPFFSSPVSSVSETFGKRIVIDFQLCDLQRQNKEGINWFHIVLEDNFKIYMTINYPRLATVHAHTYIYIYISGADCIAGSPAVTPFSILWVVVHGRS